MGRKTGRTPARRARQFPPRPFKLRPEDTEWSDDRLEAGRRRLARLKAQFASTGNPLHAWTAYAEARVHKLAVPIWVHQYFDLAWRNLMFLKLHELPKKRRIDSEIVKALGFVRGGVMVASWQNAFEGGRVPRDATVKKHGQVSPFARKKRGAYNPFTQPDDFKYAVQIYASLLEGHKLLHAYERTQHQFTKAKSVVSRRTIERAWATYSAYFPPLATK